MAEPAERFDLAQLTERQSESASEPNSPDIQMRLTPVQSAGLWLTWAVFGLIAVLLVALFMYWWIQTPSLAAFGTPATADSVALHTHSADSVLQRVRSVLDLAVV